MAPVGVTPPARVAVSLMVPPTATLIDDWVVMVGVALVTVTVSLASSHAVMAGLLLASPL